MSESPYIGLVPYSEAEEHVRYFFARERDCEMICANLMASRLTLLYGSSGVGKTSVLNAGVARKLRLKARQNLARRGRRGPDRRGGERAGDSTPAR